MKQESLADEYKEMSRTMYLFGVEASYFPEQEAFARRRIEMAIKMKKTLSKVSVEGITRDDRDALYLRHGEADEALEWSRKLLAEVIESRENASLMEKLFLWIRKQYKQTIKRIKK